MRKRPEHLYKRYKENRWGASWISRAHRHFWESDDATTPHDRNTTPGRQFFLREGTQVPRLSSTAPQINLTYIAESTRSGNRPEDGCGDHFDGSNR